MRTMNITITAMSTATVVTITILVLTKPPRITGHRLLSSDPPQ
jgi:hypothetical protein